ncbi:amino acid adenylation domain-containing protein, partial [Rhodococcus sp. Q]|uniref:non-ribosomal peptide synthetase n=1 Tax=Rhodococcus sp. Q TaxID=2502252 RepID=UPI0010FA1360
LDTPEIEFGGLSVVGMDSDVVLAKFDLDFGFVDTYDDEGAPAGLVGGLTYATALFDAAGVQRLTDGLLRILRAVTADSELPVGDIDLLGVGERELVLREWNGSAAPVLSSTLDSLFVDQVVATPDAVALVGESETLTYREFDSRVNAVARHLIGLGVGVESRVVLAMRRSVDQVIAMYAVVRAGGAYVPVDPDQPAERIGYVIDIADPLLVLVDAGADLAFGRDVVEVSGIDQADGRSVTDADRIGVLGPENTAYVLFTSGSTGRPKGVAVTHAAAVNQLVSMQSEYRLDEQDSVLQKTPATFDASVWEFFWPLQTGARLVLAGADGHRDPQYLARVLVEQSVTTVQFVPSMLPMVMAALPESGTPALRRMFAGGEPLPVAVAAEFGRVTGARVHNLYGPTEAAMQVTRREVTDADVSIVPIGGPVAGTKVFVLDSRLRPVPVGVPGELYLAGVQLARGYESRSDLTAERFVANPFGGGERMYRTGDLARWTSAGELEFLGRTDFQVKLHGLRIELGEVEAALAEHPSVRAAAAAVVATAAGLHLVGYVTAAEGVDVDVAEVTSVAADRLPAYMVPSRVLVLEAFPVNSSGKLDRKALPVPVFEAAEFRAPVTEAEQVVAAV